jgi:hypothetical protein
MLGGIRIDRLVRAAVNAEVGLPVAVEVQAAQAIRRPETGFLKMPVFPGLL